MRFSPTWKLGPGIAESWTNPDPKTLVYTIRQDAKFWDGNPVTADDVVYSLNRNMDPKSGSIWIAFYSNVKSITVQQCPGAKDSEIGTAQKQEL